MICQLINGFEPYLNFLRIGSEDRHGSHGLRVRHDEASPAGAHVELALLDAHASYLAAAHGEMLVDGDRLQGLGAGDKLGAVKLVFYLTLRVGG